MVVMKSNLITVANSMNIFNIYKIYIKLLQPHLLEKPFMIYKQIYCKNLSVHLPILSNITLDCI
jgi:hypothetical protein